MTNYTPNINLKKPLETDIVDINDFNSNYDKIDQAIGEVKMGSNKVEELETTDKTIAGAINEVKNNQDSISTQMTEKVSLETLNEYKLQITSELNKVEVIPKGLISMWSGTIETIPLGWALCDGLNETPDLRDRFIMGANSESDVGETGGENQVLLTTAQIPSHNHTGSTNSTGSHSHMLAINEGDPDYRGPVFIHSSWQSGGNFKSTNISGSHSHTINLNSTGGGQAHENRPSYYKLAFIMKI